MIEPNYQSIIITNAIGLALLGILVVSSYLTRTRRHLDDRIFALMIAVCAGACICEPATWLVDGRPEPWAFFINYFGNLYCYLGSCFCPYLWVLYVDIRLHKGRDRIRSLLPMVFVPVLALTLLNIGNIFGHYMFVISDENVYSRLPLSYLNYVMMFVQFFYSAWLKHKYQRKHGRVQFFPIAMFLLPIVIGAGLQAAVYGISLAWPSMCIGLVGIHMSLQNELSYIDSLTNLYNRMFLDSTLQTMERNNKRFGGIMIDLDFFKGINDTYGHSTGDSALADTARLLVANAPDDATVIRYAGDEFVMLVPDADKERLADIEQAIVTAVSDFNSSAEKRYRLSLSMGSSVYRGNEDSTDEFLRRIDERMYAQKREHHAQAAKDALH